MENNPRSLKELTWENHKRAETTSFIKRLIKKEISAYEYSTYLANQYLMYRVLEEQARIYISDLSFLDKIKRNGRILRDYEEIATETAPKILPSTFSYIKHIQEELKTENDILSHLYVRHMGDLYGGQILKRLVPGSGRMYEFDGNIEDTKIEFRKKLDISMATEANKCFEMIIKFLEEMEDSFANLAQTN
jgi:heme oxygenase